MKTILFFILLTIGSSGADRIDTLDAEWLFENSFEKEYIRINEAVSVAPDELREALAFYHQGSYRRAADILFQVRKLNLPDGNLDFISFLLAECYRKLNLKSKAIEEYRFVATRFGTTDKRAPALYRLLEYMASDGNIDGADSIRAFFSGSMKNHPLYNSVLYTCAHLYFDQERFEEAAQLLKEIPSSSHRYIQATFLASLCYVQLNDWEKALSLLEYIVEKAENIDVRTEALIVMGDIHYKNNRIEKAMSYYRKVSEKASRYEYALVKITRCLLDLGWFEKASTAANAFLEKRTDSEYFFEMASILEQAFENMGKEKQAAEVSNRIHRQIVSSRITFEIFDEIDRLTDLIKQWQIREYYAMTAQRTSEAQRALNGRKKAENLRQQVRSLLQQIDKKENIMKYGATPNVAERRYLVLLKKTLGRMEDSITVVKNRLEKMEAARREHPSDSMQTHLIDSLQRLLESKEHDYRLTDHEHELIISECLGGNAEEKRVSEDVQVKFIDWEFMKYLEKKDKLVEYIKKMNQLSRKTLDTTSAAKRDSVVHTATVVSSQKGDTTLDSTMKILEMDSNRTEQMIDDERERLISHIETMLDIFPKSRYAPATLFRLSELYFDRAADLYRRKMELYEKQLMTGNDSSVIPFPEYDLKDALKTYKRLYNDFPTDRLADNAMYYASIALKKQGMDDSAQTMLINMIDKYPQSEFYVEANMNIGLYFFEHAKNYQNGYKLAEDAFRKVLFYRDHPQFVQALYHLGWCYYMQDRYDEAIAAFKYMIEEVDLEFDPFAKEEKDVANPLLRSEAIDYLAISFDQDHNVNDAMEFFNLIGSEDYAALVMNRMGELREEDLDFNGAVSTYKLLLDKYPMSLSAPEAMARLIKLHNNVNDTMAAQAECRNFINTFGAGGNWQQRVLEKDSTLLIKIDSMVIAIGLTIADNTFRAAQEQDAYDLYTRAAEAYRHIVEKYPVHPGAADAAWNYAVLLNDKLGDKPAAFERFIAFSRYPGVDSIRRENAALNAIAIAQSLLPPDSVSQKGIVDFASAKMVEAVNNYTELFSGGASGVKVQFALGGVYFNRNLYQKASEIYQHILEDTLLSEEQQAEALLLLGQCRFGEEKWTEAANYFEMVRKRNAAEAVSTKAYTLLQQSLFFDAKALMQAEKHEAAAAAFTSINERFPGSEYGDVALFNAAESFEKLEQWGKANDRYFDLVKGYPSSKLAPDALFNAAGNFEKTNKFNRAAETYEMLIAQYPTHEKAKDALFNLGFCYEKLGRLDDMTAANERYSLQYPEEKDVETLLMRSALYYVKTGVFDKAINLFKNFIRRFPQSPKAVEAYYQIGKCQYDQNDRPNALLSFMQAEQHNARLEAAGGPSNNYYASEAALYHGIILQAEFNQIKLHQPESLIKQLLKEKTDLLSEAAKDFQRVMQYRSEKMFEAGFRIGELYDSLAEALIEQERQSIDPIKTAVAENDIMNMASQMMQNTFLPYKKILQLSKEADSLSVQQTEWVERARLNLSKNLLLAGTMLYNGVGAMQNAPVPKEIQEKPLLNYQYKIKLLETLEPLKRKVLNYYVNLLDSLPTLHLDDSLTISCEINIARLNYLIGSAYDKLAIDILNSTKNLPKNLSDNEKEDLLFQLEDIVYELQDKALLQLEDARQQLVMRHLDKSDWFGKINEALARLNPDKYGQSFFTMVDYQTDRTWLCRSDSILDWSSSAPPAKGWKPGQLLNKIVMVKKVRPDNAPFITGDSTWRTMYVWKNLFLAGKPTKATIAIAVPGKYRLLLNGILTLSDTAGSSDKFTYDSLSSIESLLKGGDNILACEITSSSSPCLFAASMHAMIDTSEHFTTAVVMPEVAIIQEPVTADTLKNQEIQQSAVVDSSVLKPKRTVEPSTMNRKQLLAEIATYRERERKALAELRRERLEIQRLRLLKTSRKK